MDNQQATKSWFIGFLDGEGCFIAERSKEHLREYSTKSSHKQQCEIRISNTEIDTLYICKEFLGKNYILSYILTGKPHKKSGKAVSELYIAGEKDCKIFYELMKDTMECRINELERILGASTTTRETSCDKNWLAGVYEAETCFTISTQSHKGGFISHKPEVIFENTNTKITEKVIKTLYNLGLSWYVRDRDQHNPKWKKSQVVSICGFKRVIRFIRVMDGLWRGSKTIRKVKLITEFCESRLKGHEKEPYSEREKQLAHEIKMKI